jgi:heat shock protein HslJ
VKTFLIFLAALPVMLTGCNKQAGGSEPKTAPALAELKNITYRGVVEQDPVTLDDGSWQGSPFVAGGASRPGVHFVRDFQLRGDLDGDRREDAAVLLAGDSGGAGENIYLAVVSLVAGRPVNRATVLVGDRIQVRGGRITDGRIVLEVLRPGPGDALCCPGELATVSYALDGDDLVPAAADVVAGRLSLDDLGGREWVLRWWDRDEPAPLSPVVTLTYADGRFGGSNGCNDYQMPVAAGEGPGEFTVGIGMATKMYCGGLAGETENRFMKQLGGAMKFGFSGGMLSLSYETEDAWGAMLFEARPPSARN